MVRPASVGDVLGGRVRLVRLLGEGGMASVYEGLHERLGQRVAVKVLAPTYARAPELVERFEREARAVARLSTRHVASVVDVQSPPGGLPFIVMDFLEGRDLEAELVERGALPAAEVTDILLQAACGVHVAHAAGIVHRDLKPANLFLAREGTDRVVKILDFGISKILGEPTKLTAPTAVMGTILYMSPEQVRASAGVDARSDVWSLGVIAYELLVGTPPFEGSMMEIAKAVVSRDPPPVERRADVPPKLAHLVRAMLQREPAQRPKDMREVILALLALGGARGVAAASAEKIVGSLASVAATAVPQRTVRMTAADHAASAERASMPPPTPRPSYVAPAPATGRAEVATPAPPARRWGWVLAFAVLAACGVALLVLASHKARGRDVAPPASAADAGRP